MERWLTGEGRMLNDIDTRQGGNMPPGNEGGQQPTEAKNPTHTTSTAILSAAKKAAFGVIEDLVGNSTSALIRASYTMIIESLTTKASDLKTITPRNHEESIDV
jgi:hypothetical protein